MDHSHRSKNIDIKHLLDFADIGVDTSHRVAWTKPLSSRLGNLRSITHKRLWFGAAIVSAGALSRIWSRQIYHVRIVHENVKTSFTDFSDGLRETLH